MKKKRILFLHTIPSPYRNPLFEKFQKEKKYSSVVYFMAKGAKNRVWKNGELRFAHKFLPGLTLNLRHKDDIFPMWVNPTVPWEIYKGRFDLVVVSGWDSVNAFIVRMTCWILGKPMIVWVGSTANEKSWRRTLMYWPVKILVKSCHALICYGHASRDYLLSLGVKKEKIFISYNSVDVDCFKKIALKNKRRKKILREKIGITNKYLVIFVGQFITRKGVVDLYDAVKKLSDKFDVGLLWVGRGPLEKDLREMGKRDKKVTQYFRTTYNQEETAEMYSIADIFVLPTHEDVFSNVVPEALASGLPVVTTKENGVTVDYIVDGENGFAIKAGSVKSIKDKIELLLTDDVLRKKMSTNTWSLIKNFNYKENVISFTKAIEFVLKRAD